MNHALLIDALVEIHQALADSYAMVQDMYNSKDARILNFRDSLIRAQDAISKLETLHGLERDESGRSDNSQEG